jgi:predicted RNA binding protein YcfA (HicA-like mRNA interferase family)
MRYSQIPLCSSGEIIAALERLGSYRGRSKGGSHVAYHRDHPALDRTFSAAVVQGKKEVPRGMLRNILISLGLSADDFIAELL